MNTFSQGDLIKIEGLKDTYLVVSNNNYITNNGLIHVCPTLKKMKKDPLHIQISGNDFIGITACEQIKLIDPLVRNCRVVDRISYSQIMNISDAIQGVFEYD